MRVAIVHDWLTGMRGGEKCLEVFCELFPEATIFTLLHKKGSVSQTIEGMKIKTSFLQHLPNVFDGYRNYLPLFPRAIGNFDLSGFDLVLSSSHCVAKGVRPARGATHICYCYTPMRYAWVFFEDYFGSYSPIKKRFISTVIERLKKWDLKTNETVDFFVAISDNVKNRIRLIYNKESDVIYPPVEVDRFNVSAKREDFYLIVSALVPYKKIDLAIRAFNALGKRLVIIGTGNARKKLRSLARPNIEFLDWVSEEDIRDYYSRCRAVIFPGEEDFGIVPLEAQACGKPVIAYAKGGVLETVVPINPDAALSVGRGPLNHSLRPASGQAWDAQKATGIFFYEQTTNALKEAVEYFEPNEDKFDPSKLRENAVLFSRDIFKDSIKNYIYKRTGRK